MSPLQISDNGQMIQLLGLIESGLTKGNQFAQEQTALMKQLLETLKAQHETLKAQHETTIPRLVNIEADVDMIEHHLRRLTDKQGCPEPQ